MSKRNPNGSELVCDALESRGVTHVFGIPGTQNVALFEALRRSRLRTVLTTHEAGAGFMANGYYRATGRVGVFATTGGPGLTNALTALAEARHDSAAVLHIVNAPPEDARAFQFQAIDQLAIVRSIAKAVFTIRKAEDTERIIGQAHETALADEPGPVVVQVTTAALTDTGARVCAYSSSAPVPTPIGARIDPSKLDPIITMLRSAKRPIVYAGHGCNSTPDNLIRFAELLNAPIIMTRSGRGVLPMDHRLALAFDYSGTGVTGCNAALSAADLVLVLGCKLGHNGTAGFRIQFPPERTVQVDTSADVLAANYQPAIALQADVAPFLSELLARRTEYEKAGRGWTDDDLSAWRDSGRAECGEKSTEPKFVTMPDGKAKCLFDALRRVLPRDAIVVTDSGLHQVLAFRYWSSLCAAGIIAPSDFQSMGFGIPAAIGAKLACPDRDVVAVIGDGGLLISGMELLTAVREEIQLGVLVFNDGALGQIRLQQLNSYGSAHATTLRNPDFSAFAKAIGANHCRLAGPPESTLRRALAAPGINLIEVPVEDSAAIQITRAKGIARRISTAVGVRKPLKWMKSRFDH